MKIIINLSLLAMSGIYLSGCASMADPYSEEAAVQRLVADEGGLEQNVDADFEGAAYDQDGKKVVCKKTEVTGSRISQYTVCRTEAEWASTQDDAARNLQESIDRGASSGSRG